MNRQTTFVATVPFEAARQLGQLPDGHRERVLHGHSFLASLHCALPSGAAAYPGGDIDAVRDCLATQVQALDYGSLNSLVDSPTDANVAHWIRTRCDLPGQQGAALQSTTDTGLRVDADGLVHTWHRFYFQAAHQLPRVPAGHKCGNMHGHGFAVLLHTCHALAEDAGQVAYDQLKAAWVPLFAELDHACLTTIEGLSNPTSELISQWLWQRIRPGLAELTGVSVFETASCGAHFDGERFQIWKDFTFDSAALFRHAPPGHPRARLHGYTYTLRLHLSAPLDEVAGWAIDFGDVKELFSPVFKAIDHQALAQLPRLPDCDTASIAHWIWAEARALLPQIYRVDLLETRGCGVQVRAGLAGPDLPF